MVGHIISEPETRGGCDVIKSKQTEQPLIGVTAHAKNKVADSAANSAPIKTITATTTTTKTTATTTTTIQTAPTGETN